MPALLKIEQNFEAKLWSKRNCRKFMNANQRPILGHNSILPSPLPTPGRSLFRLSSKQKILCPRISTLTGTTLAPPVMTEQYWYTCPITTYYRTNLTTIIVGLSLMLKKMNESNLPRPILGVSSEKWCCNQLSVNLSTKLEQSSFVNIEGKIHYETGKIVLMVSFSLYHLDCVHFPSFLFVLLSVFEYWSPIIFVIFIFSACVMICRWIMICCLLNSTHKTYVAHFLNRDKEVILEEKTERESGAGKRVNVLEAVQDEKMGKWEMDRVDFLSYYHQRQGECVVKGKKTNPKLTERHPTQFKIICDELALTLINDFRCINHLWVDHSYRSLQRFL